MSNILKALKNVAENPKQDLVSHYQNGKNRINEVGYALEEYIKDAFADTINEIDQDKKMIAINKVFSWTGNQNNPPDAIIKNGDAIEIKKIGGYKNAIALNSSYPKRKLYYDDPKLTSECRESEFWKEKDIIYAIGTVKNNKLLHLWFVYGDCYAASKEVYERIANHIKDGVNSIPGVEFSKSKELGKVKRVDPLGITYLRIRGMWNIENPSVVFRNKYDPGNIENESSNLKMVCIMRKEKFELFPMNDQAYIKKSPHFQIQNILIPEPNNPAKLLSAVLITYSKGI